MSATAAPEAPAVARERELHVQTPETTVLFMARRSSLRLVLRPTRQTRDAEGNVAETIQGATLAFHEGVLRIPKEGDVDLEAGNTMPAEDVLARLERHKRFGDVNEGFWRVDPVAPPPSQEELDTLMRLATELDADGLQAFIAAEREGWAREALLTTAEGALERMAALRQSADANAAAAIEKARKEGREEAGKRGEPGGGEQ